MGTLYRLDGGTKSCVPPPPLHNRRPPIIFFALAFEYGVRFPDFRCWGGDGFRIQSKGFLLGGLTVFSFEYISVHIPYNTIYARKGESYGI